MEKYFFIKQASLYKLSILFCYIFINPSLSYSQAPITPTSTGFYYETKQTDLPDYNKLPQTVYTDPDNDEILLTQTPGLPDSECKKNPQACHIISIRGAELKRDTKSQIQNAPVYNDATEETDVVPFAKVDYEYDSYELGLYSNEIKSKQRKKITGWIDARTLHEERFKPIYSESEEEQKKVDPSCKRNSGTCPIPNIKPNKPSNNLVDIKNVSEKLNRDLLTPKKKVLTAIDAVSPFIGNCPISPPNKKRFDRWSNKNLYDLEVLPYFNKLNPKQFASVPKEIAPGKFVPATRDDLINIDALARTLYSEMNGCFKVGVEYPMAVAKVVLNRAQLKESNKLPKHFTGNPNDETKPLVSQIVAAPFQFSVWNTKGKSAGHGNTSLMALCPTKDNSENNWKKDTPNKLDKQAWELSLKIATEAILFKDEFNKKTKQVSQLYYTSKRSSYDKRRKPNPPPKIEGRKVESYQCMYLWNGK